MNGAKRNHGIMDGASCDRSLRPKMSCFEFCCVCGFQCHISSERKEDGWLTDHLLNGETLIFVSGLSPCSRPIWLTATARRRKHPKTVCACVRVLSTAGVLAEQLPPCLTSLALDLPSFLPPPSNYVERPCLLDHCDISVCTSDVSLLSRAPGFR